MDHAYHKNLAHVGWQEVWDRQARRAPLMDEYWRLARGQRGMRVLDVGCGPGFFALDVARRVGQGGIVVALDSDPDALAFVRRRMTPLETPTLGVVAANAEDELPAGPFDLVLVTNVLHHADAPARILRHARKVGARILVAEFDPEGAGELGPPRAARLAPDVVAGWMRDAGWRVEGPTRHAFEQYAFVGS